MYTTYATEKELASATWDQIEGGSYKVLPSHGHNSSAISILEELEHDLEALKI